MLARERSTQVYVVSSDEDFRKACEQHDALILFDRIETAIEHSLRTPEAVVDSLHEWLHDNIGTIFDQAEERLKAVTFSLDAVSGYIHSMEVQDHELLDEAVVELSEEHGVLSASIHASVRFKVEYAVEGDSFYDSEDRLVIPYEDVFRDLDVCLVFPVRVAVNIGMRAILGLRGISLDIANEVDITPNDDWEFEIQSI